jgi:hypothetical protein
MLAMPCCVAQDLPAPHILVYDQSMADLVPSPYNRMLVYECVRPS